MSALPARLKYQSQRERSTGLKWYKAVFPKGIPTNVAGGSPFSRQPCRLVTGLSADSVLSALRLPSSRLPSSRARSKLLFASAHDV